MNRNSNYSASITNLDSLRKAQLYHEIKIVEKEALIKANYSILKSKYGNGNWLKSIFISDSANNLLGISSFGLLKKGATSLIDVLLKKNHSFIGLLSKNLIHILSSKYQFQIQSYLNRFLRIFN